MNIGANINKVGKWYNGGVMSKSSESLILLTYKEKILLMIRDFDLTSRLKKTWSMIGGKKESDESFEKSIAGWVKEETNIEVSDVQFILSSPSDEKNIYFFHGKLTDSNVNHIERAEGQELQFFNLEELSKLQLASSADLFFTQHRSAIEELLIN